MEYEFNSSKIKERIKKLKPKRVLMQLPDGLKPDYEKIVKELEGDYELFIWGGTCFGACDTPNIPSMDLLIQLGHEEMR